MSWSDRLKARHQERRDQNLWRERISLSSPQGRNVTIDGRSFLNFCSNDYLGLANHPMVKQAGMDAIQNWGAGTGASHLICGHLQIHDQLEQRMADFIGAESAIVFSGGYMANLSIAQAFLDRNGLLLEDRFNHASLIDAGQLCRAKMKRYPHLDYQTADRWLAARNDAETMLMTDSVFSMDGDVAPLQEISHICKKQGSLLVVDEAHGIGVCGKNGRGILNESDLKVTGNLLVMGTLGKSLGSFGAFVGGDKSLIDHLIQFGRTYIYTTALPPSAIGAALESLRRMETESWRQRKLNENISFFRDSIGQTGIRLLNSRTAIQPVVLGSAKQTIDAAAKLWNKDLLILPIRPPTVPEGQSRLRITLTSEHDQDDIRHLVDCLASLEIPMLPDGVAQ